MVPSPYPHIQSFLDYLTFEKRYSPHTSLSYQTDLEQFFTYAALSYETSLPADITTPMIRSWLAELKSRKISSKSINRKISALKSYFKYLLKRGEITRTPVATVISPKN